MAEVDRLAHELGGVGRGQRHRTEETAEAPGRIAKSAQNFFGSPTLKFSSEKVDLTAVLGTNSLPKRDSMQTEQTSAQSRRGSNNVDGKSTFFFVIPGFTVTWIPFANGMTDAVRHLDSGGSLS